MSRKAALKFWTIERFRDEDIVEGFLIPFTLHVEDDYPRSLHARAVRRTARAPVVIEVPSGQNLPSSDFSAIKTAASDYYFTVIAAAETNGNSSRRIRRFREYPIDL
jgi:hypothetical protein